VRLCQLTDSASRDYRPGYLSSIQVHVASDEWRVADSNGMKTHLPFATDHSPLFEVAEALDLVRRIRACPYRSQYSKCGCSGARCALRRGAIVSYSECFQCSRRYDSGPDDRRYDDRS
jgi:hypothetical protein